jgi:hypothetical protein
VKREWCLVVCGPRSFALIHVDLQREFLNPPTHPSSTPMAQPQPHQHRNLQPTAGPPPPAGPLNRPRLDESLDAIRHEFEYMNQELTAIRNQRDEYETKSPSFLLLFQPAIISFSP